MRRFLLLVLVLSCLVAPAWAASYFQSPTGNDSANGLTTGTPWQTFAKSIPLLVPGDSLTLLDGTYTTSHAITPILTGSTDVLGIKCDSGGNAVNGTAGAPITIKAQTDRKALIQGSGKIVVYLLSCAWWQLEGLYIRNIDINPGSGYEGTNLVLSLSDHITVKRNLIYYPNAWFNSHGIGLYNTNNSLIEDTEVYGAPRHGINQGHDLSSNNPTGNIIRRNYINGRQHGPMVGGFTCPGSCENTTTDEGISLYPGQDAIFENNIIEDAAVGFSIQGTKDPFNNKYLGNITGAGAGIGTWASMGFGPRDGDYNGTARQMPTDIVMENNVVLNGTYVGCGACKRLTWKNMTMINSTEGFAANSFSGGDGHTSVTGTNMLAMGNSVQAYDIQSQESQSFDYLRNFNNANQSFPSGATHTSTNDPNMGTCRVYIPSTSNLKGAGLGGEDIGANVLYRYQNGVLTATPLWDTTTGVFTGCGTIIAGVNDTAGNSCINAHTRFNVNSGGCPFPLDYGPGGTTSVGTFYISPTGDDARSCLTAQTLTTPKRTIASAVACMAGGSTLFLRGGTYIEALDTVTRPVAGGTSWLTATTIAAYQNEVVTIQNPGAAASVLAFASPATDPYIILDKLHLNGANVASSNGLRVTGGSHHIRFQNGEVLNTTLSGIYVEDATNVEILTSRVHAVAGGLGTIALVNSTDQVLIQGNELDNNANTAVNLDATSGTKTNTSIHRNLIHNHSGAGKAGLELTGTGIATNNVFYTNTVGIWAKTGSSNFKVYNNTITASSGNGLQVDSGATGTLLTNNISFGNGTALSNSGTSTVQTTNLTTDPLFANAAAHDYQLQPLSVARNTGTNLGEVLVDYAGVTRPQGTVTDIGAYEALVGSGPTGGPVAPTNLHLVSTAVGSVHTVTLGWDYTPTDLFSGAYNLYRQTGCTGTAVKLNVSLVRANTLTYTDGTVPPGATYCWTVRAQNNAGVESADSNTATYTAATYAPGTIGLTVTLTGGPTTWTAHLTWTFTNGTPATTGFNVYRFDNCGVSGRTKLNGSLLATGTLVFDDAGVQNGKSHCWLVAGQDATAAEGLFSGLVSIPVPAVPGIVGMHGAGAGASTMMGGRR